MESLNFPIKYKSGPARKSRTSRLGLQETNKSIIQRAESAIIMKNYSGDNKRKRSANIENNNSSTLNKQKRQRRIQHNEKVQNSSEQRFFEGKNFILIGPDALTFSTDIEHRGGIIVKYLTDNTDFIILDDSSELSMHQLLTLDTAVEMKKVIVSVGFVKSCISEQKMVDVTKYLSMRYNYSENEPLTGTLAVMLKNSCSYLFDMKKLFGKADDMPQHYDITLKAIDGSFLYANRCLLVARSNYFKNIINTDSAVIVVPLTAASLWHWMEYIHTSKTKITSATIALELVKFLTNNGENCVLESELILYVKQEIANSMGTLLLGNLCEIYSSLSNLDCFAEERKIISEKISTSSDLVFDNCPKALVEQLAQRSSLAISECSLFERIFSWGLKNLIGKCTMGYHTNTTLKTDKIYRFLGENKYCLGNNDFNKLTDVPLKDIRALIGNIIQFVRFENITPEQTIEFLTPLGFFNNVELLQIISSYCNAKRGLPFSLFGQEYIKPRQQRWYTDQKIVSIVTVVPSEITTVNTVNSSTTNNAMAHNNHSKNNLSVGAPSYPRARKVSKQSVSLDYVTNNKISFDTFIFLGSEWYVMVAPVDKNGSKYLGLYLYNNNIVKNKKISSLTTTLINFKLINFNTSKNDKSKCFSKTWDNVAAWGFDDFIEIKELRKIEEGWIKDKKIHIHVSIEEQ